MMRAIGLAALAVVAIMEAISYAVAAFQGKNQQAYNSVNNPDPKGE